MLLSRHLTSLLATAAASSIVSLASTSGGSPGDMALNGGLPIPPSFLGTSFAHAAPTGPKVKELPIGTIITTPAGNVVQITQGHGGKSVGSGSGTFDLKLEIGSIIEYPDGTTYEVVQGDATQFTM